MSDAQVESAACELLRKYAKWKGAQAEPPIDVDNIAEGVLELDFGIDDLKSRFGMHDVLGATWFDLKKIRIDSSLETLDGRFAFTVGHEIGHWQLHRPQYELDKSGLALFRHDGTSNAVPAVVCRGGVKDSAEHQADAFASFLLIPKTALLAAVQELCGASPPVWSGLQRNLNAKVADPRLKAFAADVIAEGKFTNVSNEAMRIRLVKMKVVRDADDFGKHLGISEKELLEMCDHLSLLVDQGPSSGLAERVSDKMAALHLLHDDHAVEQGVTAVRTWVKAAKRRLGPDDLAAELDQRRLRGKDAYATLLVEAIDRDPWPDSAVVRLDWVDLFTGDEPRERQSSRSPVSGTSACGPTSSKLRAA